MRVAQLQRIKGPFHQTKTAAQSLIALKQFQRSADAMVAVVGLNSGLVRMQIRPVVPPSDHCQGIANKLVAVEGAQDLTSGVRGHDEHRYRLDFQVRLAPDFAL
jgi:hypothetical protein